MVEPERITLEQINELVSPRRINIHTFKMFPNSTWQVILRYGREPKSVKLSLCFNNFFDELAAFSFECDDYRTKFVCTEERLRIAMSGQCKERLMIKEKELFNELGRYQMRMERIKRVVVTLKTAFGWLKFILLLSAIYIAFISCFTASLNPTKWLEATASMFKIILMFAVWWGSAYMGYQVAKLLAAKVDQNSNVHGTVCLIVGAIAFVVSLQVLSSGIDATFGTTIKAQMREYASQPNE